VVLVEIADADVTDRDVVGVVEVPADNLAGGLADAVLVAGAGSLGSVEQELPSARYISGVRSPVSNAPTAWFDDE
jgi:hypothetical protein